MSGTGKVGTALDETRKSDNFVMEIEDNSVLYEILRELRKLNKQIEIMTGEDISDY